MDRKILLIDDSAILRRIATNVLGARPGRCEVVTAMRATEGFARACRSGMDLILVDFQIAGPSDVEFCQRLLHEPRTAHVPVVLLLRRGMKPPASDALPDNVVFTLVKPFTPEELVSTVDTIFEAAKAGASFRGTRERFSPNISGKTLPLTDHLAVTAAVGPIPPEKSEALRVQEPALCQGYASSTTHLALPLENRTRSGVPALRAAFRDITDQNLTGVLRFSPHGFPPTEVYVDGGQIVVVATRDAVAYSEEAADVLPAKVSPAMLECAVVEQERDGIPFFLQLGVRGLLSKASAVALIHRFGQRHFARLWTLRPAEWEATFEPMAALPGFAMRLESRRESVDEWLLGSLRHLQIDDVMALRRHEGLVGTGSYRRDGTTLAQYLNLTEQEREFTKAIDGRRDLPTIAQTLGLTGEHAFLLLYRFRCLEIMEYRPAPSAFVVTPRTNVRRVLPLLR